MATSGRVWVGFRPVLNRVRARHDRAIVQDEYGHVLLAGELEYLLAALLAARSSGQIENHRNRSAVAAGRGSTTGADDCGIRKPVVKVALYL